MLVTPGGWGGPAILCVLGMCRPQGYVFHNVCLGRVLLQPNSLARVHVSWFLSGKGVFRPNSLARGVFFSWFDTKILARDPVVFYLFFLGRVGNFCLGRVRVCHPGLHTPIHNLVKSPPPLSRLGIVPQSITIRICELLIMLVTSVSNELATERADTPVVTSWPLRVAAFKVFRFIQPAVLCDKGRTERDKRLRTVQ